ncbi:MAG: hypothetical protein HUJ55_07005 [Ileibacterium sp.]|nr:hypothetical protein [Ileibacterium sp.]
MSKAQNGFALPAALCAFVLILMLCSLCTLSLHSKVWLMRAQKQSDFDLALIRQARQTAVENEGKRKCFPEIKINPFSWKTIQGKEVRFEDRQTCVEMIWMQNGKELKARLFYSQAGILSFEYVR